MTELHDDVEIGTKGQVTWLKYVNTFLLSCITIGIVYLAISMSSIKDSQRIQDLQITTIIERQNVNTQNVANLNTRVTNIESQRTDEIKQWVETYFARKSEVPILAKQPMK